MNAITAAYTTGRRVFENPDGLNQQGAFANSRASYPLLKAYYTNEIFDDISTWAGYKRRYNLYRNIRPIYNPTRRLVDFYAGSIYPGALSEDGSKLPDGVSLAIPFSEDTAKKLKSAVAQFWQWSNFQALKSVIPREGGIYGAVLVEVLDDVERGKVGALVWSPSLVADLVLDNAGNVKKYALEYQLTDGDPNDVRNPTGITYTYREEVDSYTRRFFKDGQPYDYDGFGAVQPNLYGFAPAVWCKHLDTGSDAGAAAISGSLGKIDELNNLASLTHDQVRKKVASPFIFWTSSSISNLINNTKRDASENLTMPEVDKEQILLLKGPADGRVDSLSSDLDLSDAIGYMEKLITEIEADHPELSFYQELRTMSQVTGPAAARLVGDVANRVMEVAAGYDQQMIKLFQMATAIGGFRANGGFWGSDLTPQQQKFKPFNLDSYVKGKLDMAIMPRPLIQPTRLEAAQERLTHAQAISAETSAGFPFEYILSTTEGLPDTEIQRIKDLKEANKPPQFQGGVNQNEPGQQTSASQPANLDSQNAPAPVTTQQARQAGSNAA